MTENLQAENLAELVIKRKIAVEEKAAAVNDFNKTIKQQSGEIEDLAAAINSGQGTLFDDDDPTMPPEGAD